MISVATTTITVLRPPVLGDDEDPALAVDVDPDEVASGVRAVLASPTGDEILAARSAQESVAFHLRCDPVDLVHDDLVVDDATGETYEVVFAVTRAAVGGLEHTVADLYQVAGNREGEVGS